MSNAHDDAPAGLVAEHFDLDGVPYVAFTWESIASASDLTPAEQSVLELLRKGASNAEIAHARSVSVRTVANQVAAILRRTRASSRYELIAHRSGIRR